tara:strand:+ start:1988 stop:2227 length:240 start_codon:yes stop_codon:yes gene_type:complete
MKKNALIRENILTTLAKMIAAFQIQRKIGDAMDKIPNDPDIKQAFKDLKAADERATKALKMFCIRNPDSPKCKDKSESK